MFTQMCSADRVRSLPGCKQGPGVGKHRMYEQARQKQQKKKSSTLLMYFVEGEGEERKRRGSWEDKRRVFLW